jgi:hypothetical protein
MSLTGFKLYSIMKLKLVMGCCVPSRACPEFYITEEEIKNFFNKIKARVRRLITSFQIAIQ